MFKWPFFRGAPAPPLARMYIWRRGPVSLKPRHGRAPTPAGLTLPILEPSRVCVSVGGCCERADGCVRTECFVHYLGGRKGFPRESPYTFVASMFRVASLRVRGTSTCTSAPGRRPRVCTNKHFRADRAGPTIAASGQNKQQACGEKRRIDARTSGSFFFRNELKVGVSIWFFFSA